MRSAVFAALPGLLLYGCSLSPVNSEYPLPPSKNGSFQSGSTAPAAAREGAHAHEEARGAARSHSVVTAHGRASPTHSKSGALTKEVIKLLNQGNERFVAGKPLHPAQTAQHRKGLASGQRPKAVILSCSDSRVPPELIFDQGLGELFVVRTAGHVADEVALASIEYALEHLGASVVVVLGHSSCGAVKAALSTPVGQSAGSKNLDTLVGAIRPHIAATSAASGDSAVVLPVKANVEGAAHALVSRSSIISTAIPAGHAKIAKGIYHLESGRVELWE